MKKKKFTAKGSRKTIPITREQFEFILAEFKDNGDLRMEIISHLLYRCVRIGDVLETLKIRDVYASGKIRDKIEFTEHKTGKFRIIAIRGEMFIDALNRYLVTIKRYPKSAPLFYTGKTGKPIKDSGVKFHLRKFVGSRGITQCSPHSFRKGGARFMYESGIRIEAIQNVLNHHSPRTTEIYIDITPKDIVESMKCLEI